MKGDNEECVAGKDNEGHQVLQYYIITGESSIPVAQLKAGFHPAETLSSINKSPSVLFETSKTIPLHHYPSTKPSTAPGAISTWLQLPLPAERREQT